MMRLDKYLANAGLGTRKEVKQLIKKKRVKINDKLCLKDDVKVDENNDVITLDDQVVSYQQFHYILLHKPSGVVSATEDNVYQTVIDLIDVKIKDLFPVGRLDLDTEGLLLLTNDGKLAHKLLSPKKNVEKCYYLEITNPLNDEHVKKIEQGIIIDECVECKPARIQMINDHSYYLWITEGKFHQVKKMILACNSEVTYLKRISMGEIKLDESLKCGEYRYCNEKELEILLSYKN